MSILRRNRTNLILALLVLAVGVVTGAAALSQTGQPVAPGRVILFTADDADSKRAYDDALSMGFASGQTQVGPFLQREGACPTSNPSCLVNEGADVGVLPAWRWSNVALDGDDSGFLGKLKEIPVLIATLFFNLANFIWRILLAVLRIGFNARDLLRIATGAINAGFAFMARNLLVVAVAMAVFGLWRIVKAFFDTRNGGGVLKALKTSVGFLFGFAALIGVMIQSREAVINHPGDVDAQLEVAGTLPWAAHETLNLADKVTNPIVSVVTGATISADPASGSSAGTTCEQGTDTYISGQVVNDFDGDGQKESFDACGNGASTSVNTCANYINALRQSYLAGPGNERTLVLVSRLWEGTLYESWKSALFGPPINYQRVDGERVASDVPERVICHWAEANNDKSVGSQYAAAKDAYGTDAFPHSVVPFVFNAASDPDGDSHALRRAMTMWAACEFDGDSWTGHRDFDGAWKDGDDQSNVYDDLCPLVMNTESYVDGQNPAKIESLTSEQGAVKDKFYFFTGSVGDAVKGTMEKQAQLRGARSYGVSFTGANAGGRILYGLTSLLVALLFTWSLGMVGIGLVAAILMAIATLVFGIPVALALVAMGKTDKAVPLFRVTLSSLLAHSFFTIVLTAIIILTGIFQALIMGLGGLQGMIAAVLKGAAPLAAFFMVRKILKSIGMADILTATGAMTFAGAAATMASGNQKWSAKAKVGSDGKNSMQRNMSKVPWMGRKLDKLDRMAPTKGNWDKAGRAKRRELNEKEKAEREKKMAEREERVRSRQQLIDRGKDPNIGHKNRWRRMRNAVDRSRIRASEATRGRLNDILDWSKDLLEEGHTRSWAYGVAVAAGFGLQGFPSRGRRPIGMPVDPDDAVPMETVPGETVDGRDAGPRRTANINQVKTYLQDAIDDALANAGADITGADKSQLIRDNLDRAVEDMLSTYTEALCGPLDGLLSNQQINGIKIDLSSKTGYSPEGILVTDGGAAIVMPFDPQKARAELTPEQLRSFVHFLPEQDRQPQQIVVTLPDGSQTRRVESEDEMASRLLAVGFARGLVNPDGSQVDVLAVNGIDIATANGRARVENWKQGADDTILDNLRIGAVDDALEERLIASARRQSERLREHFDAAARAAEQAAQRTVADWRNGTPGGIVVQQTPITGSTPTPPVDLGAISQIALAVSAARELLEVARRDKTDMTAAAAKMTTTMERLESSQAAMVANLESAMVDNLERQIAAMQQEGDVRADRFEEVFAKGVESIDEVLAQTGSIFDSFRNGVTGLEETIEKLGRIVSTVNESNRELGERLDSDITRLMGSMRAEGMRRPKTTVVWKQGKSARDAVQESGGSPIPGSES